VRLLARGLAACLIGFAAIASAQEGTTSPAVVLSRVQVSYPPIAEAALVSGKVNLRAGVRPDGSVAGTTLLQGVPLLNDAAVAAASRASFECRGCTEPETPHTLAFVFSFSLGGFDSAGNPRPPEWKQTGPASSEVTVFGQVPVLRIGPPSKPFHKRAARCVWLWHCSKQAYVTPIK
jgi:Gram-negative bacterial TonB protein C-terminal